MARNSDDFDVFRALAVFDGQVCCGHIVSRGPNGFEGFDVDDKSLGVFPTQKAAADALTAKAVMS